ncbi:MAG: DUF6089 family protein [Bacteroidota bacterium]
MSTFMIHQISRYFILAGLLIGLFSLDVHAQRTHVLSGGVGTVYYYGELTDVFASSQMKPAGVISYQKYFNQTTSYRFGLSAGEIGATDFYANSPGRKVRNLHFKSIILEASATMVHEFFPDRNFGNEYLAKPHFSPYVFGGVAFFHFNPKARLGSQWYALQPLGTEGQNLPGGRGRYSRVQMALPVGIGGSLRISPNSGISIELGYRLTLTDYLDDISTIYPDLDALMEVDPLAAEFSERSPEGVFESGDIRGNPGSNDGYFFATFSLNYYLSRFLNRN